MTNQTEPTVEVPARLLADLAYHFSVTTNMQAIPTTVIAPLAELAPDPDEPLRNHVRWLIGDDDLPHVVVNHIIKVVREYDA